MVALCIIGNKWHDISADGKTTLCGHPVWPQSKKVGDVTLRRVSEAEGQRREDPQLAGREHV